MMAMIDTEKPQFLEMLVGVADYYDKELSEMSIAVYWAGLRKYDLKAIKRAFFNHTQSPDNGNFMPRVSAITLMLEGTSTDTAYLAWTKVENAVKRCGSYQDVVFDDWIIHRVIFDMGGWILMCGKTEKEWPFIGKEFEQRYRGYAIKRVAEQYPMILIGQAGAHNRKSNYPVEPPILIGDAAKAQAVLSGGVDLVRIGMTQATDLAGNVAKQLTDKNV